MLTQAGGAELTAKESKVSLHGSGGKTRTLAVPLTPPAVAFTKPACAAVSLPAVKLPFSIVPFNCSSDQFAAGSSRMKLPCASKSRARKLTLSPGLSISSVGTTCTHVADCELTVVPTAAPVPDELWLVFLPMQ